MENEAMIIELDADASLEETKSISDQPIPFFYILGGAAFIGVWGVICLASACIQFGLVETVLSFFNSIM